MNPHYTTPSLSTDELTDKETLLRWRCKDASKNTAKYKQWIHIVQCTTPSLSGGWTRRRRNSSLESLIDTTFGSSPRLCHYAHHGYLWEQHWFYGEFELLICTFCFIFFTMISRFFPTNCSCYFILLRKMQGSKKVKAANKNISQFSVCAPDERKNEKIGAAVI